MINEDAPTMSAGTGGFSGSAAATGPVAGFDPMLGKGKKVKKRKYKPKGHVVTNVGIGEHADVILSVPRTIRRLTRLHPVW